MMLGPPLTANLDAKASLVARVASVQGKGFVVKAQTVFQKNE